jgi:hypothetical protein
MDEGGDEYGLPGARHPGDAEPDRGVDEMIAELDERPGGEPGTFHHL